MAGYLGDPEVVFRRNRPPAAFMRLLQTLRKLVSQGARFRLTGWLLFDQEHPEQIGQFRATLWEIHPITRIEVFTGGKWVEL